MRPPRDHGVMRRTDQRVERRIRLWVVKQERLRLTNGQTGGIHAQAEEPHEAPAPTDAPAGER